MQNKLTIIPSDKAVYVDGVCLSDLELSGIPENIHALQWVQGVGGWLEIIGEPNEPIEELPQWAIDAIAVWEIRLDEINNPPVIVIPLTQQDFINAIKKQLNDVAIARSYESEYSIASYVNSTNLDWKADAETYIAWRDAVWAYGYAELAAIEGGAPVPTIENFIAAAPQIQW
jgi:hypothetical protein